MLTLADQDERLNLLSHSIGRQNHLSIQIGDELDQHHELLEETDAAMDRTAARLNSARRRLNRVADDARQHGASSLPLVAMANRQEAPSRLSSLSSSCSYSSLCSRHSDLMNSYMRYGIDLVQLI